MYFYRSCNKFYCYGSDIILVDNDAELLLILPLLEAATNILQQAGAQQLVLERGGGSTGISVLGFSCVRLAAQHGCKSRGDGGTRPTQILAGGTRYVSSPPQNLNQK
jgi:Ethanolamine utilization protein EutJ (predicted chaperonin)